MTQTVLRPTNDEELWTYEARRAVKRLRDDLEYAYRCVDRGFKYGDFDFSVLRERASEAVAQMDEIDGPLF